MLKLLSFPEKLPGTSADLLTVLDAIVPSERLRPGDDPQQSLYQSGARDLVDMLIERFELERNPKAEKEESWTDQMGQEYTDYVEGDW